MGGGVSLRKGRREGCQRTWYYECEHERKGVAERVKEEKEKERKRRKGKNERKPEADRGQIHFSSQKG